MPEPTLPDPASLGFLGDEVSGWTRSIRDREVRFRVLRSLAELAQAERLQSEVFGVSERDLIPANELIVVAETGGAVIAAFAPKHDDLAAGVVVGWGGFVGRPRIVSDFLAVRPGARNLGLAAELKRLQAAIALGRGFKEIVWTVDPLRAANARLNFGKLGAIATRYEVDRYGSDFAPNLYGGMPTDRVHVTWAISSPEVIARLRGQVASPLSTKSTLEPFISGTEQRSAFVDIPADIDALLLDDPAQARDWQLRVRNDLVEAIGESLAITGFQPAEPGGQPALILERLNPAETEHPQ